MCSSDLEATELLAKILKVTKASIKGVSMLASAVWPAAKEAKAYFRAFAERVQALEPGVHVEAVELLGKAIAVAEIAHGAFELIEGIAHGDGEHAYKGAEKALMGGSTLLMESTAAGTGATLVAPALVFMFAETVKA